MDRLVGIERQRLKDQLAALDERMATMRSVLQELDDPGLKFALAEGERNRMKLDAAIQGHAPSAVVGRRAQHPNDDSAERRALARAEAAHAADNVLAFLGQLDGTIGDDPIQRAARWLLRLELELLDADADINPAEVRELALSIVRSKVAHRPTAVAKVVSQLQIWRKQL